VTVLRDGKDVGIIDTASSRPTDVVTAMIGKALQGSIAEAALTSAKKPRLGPGTSGQTILSVRGLREDGKVAETSFDLHKGEVLGVTGLVGSGQSELVSLIAGVRQKTGGTILHKGVEQNFRTPRDAIKRGIGLLPQDRKAHGFVAGMSVADNMVIASLPMFSRFGVISEGRIRERTQGLAERLEMRIFGVQQAMGTLSGGTQQKGILARWLIREVDILLCDEPTRGVDVGAKEEMYRLLSEFAHAGGTVILASSELSEAVLCDRVLVMSKGKVVAEIDHDEIDPDAEAIISRLG
jgi:ribose transport system ATP-binding protein